MPVLGEGVRSLVFSVVGGLFNSISKITGSVADLVSATTGNKRSYEIASEKEHMEKSGVGQSMFNNPTTIQSSSHSLIRSVFLVARLPSIRDSVQVCDHR